MGYPPWKTIPTLNTTSVASGKTTLKTGGAINSLLVTTSVALSGLASVHVLRLPGVSHLPTVPGSTRRTGSRASWQDQLVRERACRMVSGFGQLSCSYRALPFPVLCIYPHQEKE